MHFRIEGLGAGFNGLVVEGAVASSSDLVQVEKIFNVDMVIGDRVVGQPLAPGSLFITKGFLIPCGNPNDRQFDSKNPFGTEVLGGRYSKDGLELTFCRYDSGALTVTVQEIGPPRKTVLSQNFFSATDVIDELISDTVKGALPIEDLVFHLRGSLSRSDKELLEE